MESVVDVPDFHLLEMSGCEIPLFLAVVLLGPPARYSAKMCQLGVDRVLVLIH